MTNTNLVDAEITTFGKSYLIFLFMVLNISVEQVGFLLVLVFFDSLFGVIREVKLKARLSWERFIWGITSKFAILLIPFFIALFGKIFKVDLVYLVQMFIYIIAANDMVSIITNISSIRSGVRYKNVDFIERGIHYLTNFFTNLVTGVLNKNGNGKP